jgi:hypothetical protein
MNVRRLRAAVRTALVAGCLVLPACASLPLPGSGPRASHERLGWKAVVEKREPGILLAVDGTECQVAEERFERVEVGDSVFCHWREGRGRATLRSPGPRSLR